jgi:hypothetical protein
MNPAKLIEKLIKSTLRRAVLESMGALFVIGALAHYLQQIPPGGAAYYGCLIIMISWGFIVGVVWSFALSERLLRVHPATDTAFWQEAFGAQARLLRLVPLWYLAPGCTGMLLFAARPGEMGAFKVMLGTVAVLFAGITWLNRHSAAKIEKDALALGGGRDVETIEHQCSQQ